MKRILIVEDDRKLNKGIFLALRKEYSCMQAFCAESALKIFHEQKLDLILLDVNLPDQSGMEVLEEIRKTSWIPVIFLTANNMEVDIVTSLESGANDYITKPFSLMVLRARVGVQLRQETVSSSIFQNEELCFDFEKMEFTREGKELVLSRTEQKLLRYFLENRGKNLTRSQIIDWVWQGETEFVEEHALTVVVNRLRSKLGDDSTNPRYIKTVYGMGYVWLDL